jgi:transposase-like protein
MKKDLILDDKKHHTKEFRDFLEETLREGARKLLQEAIENEVREYMQLLHVQRDENGKRTVVRNGYLPERSILTGIGPITIKQPRVRDKRKEIMFTSAILPPYMRRVPSIDAVIPALYLKGISTGDFPEALESILGENAKGLSSTNIVRLKKTWEEEFKEWSQRDLSGKRYVYMWADGIYFNVRLEENRPCLLVVIGALDDGTKEIIAIHDGHRESKESWKEVLHDIKRRGVSIEPCLAIGDGALGFWAALEEMFSTTKHQRCWVHKTVNVLDKMAKSTQSNAKTLLHEMYMAPTKEEGLKAFDSFINLYEAKYPKACECLKKDKDQLFTFYDFPAEHWQHIRTTNPIESTFATIRHRTRQTKGCGSRLATLTMVFKLALSAQKHWRKLKGYQLIEKLIKGIRFKDGIEVRNSEEVVA